MIDNEPTNKSAWDRELTERGIGILALVGAGVLAYFFIAAPLLAAARHDRHIDFSMKAACFTPLLLALGVIYTIFGDSTARFLGPRHRPSALGYVFYIFFFMLGVGLYFWMKAFLRSQGYQV
jgi:Na+-driven multidrug efflux pump